MVGGDAAAVDIENGHIILDVFRKRSPNATAQIVIRAKDDGDPDVKNSELTSVGAVTLRLALEDVLPLSYETKQRANGYILPVRAQLRSGGNKQSKILFLDPEGESPVAAALVFSGLVDIDLTDDADNFPADADAQSVVNYELSSSNGRVIAREDLELTYVDERHELIFEPTRTGTTTITLTFTYAQAYTDDDSQRATKDVTELETILVTVVAAAVRMSEES